LILIPILITAIGDGLAEPVGVRFGRYKYRVSALFTDKKYYRTLEGSACVFITSLVIVGLYQAAFTAPQFVAAMIVMPVVMTLVEAFSPHTWDSPSLFLAGYLVLFGISFI
jgi:dolichol kinase